MKARLRLDGGVLLLWGKKSSDAPAAQVNLVEQKLSPERGIAPGLVLYLMPPNQASETVPAWGWPVLRWRTGDEALPQTKRAGLGALDEESPMLDNFLAGVLMHWMRRDEIDAGSAAATKPARPGPA